MGIIDNIRQASTNLLDNPLSSFTSHEVTRNFGWHPFNKDGFNGLKTPMRIAKIAFNILSHVPALCFFSGVFHAGQAAYHMYKVCQGTEFHTENHLAAFFILEARSITECSGLGIFFPVWLVLDIGATIHDALK
ncbi:MAG: hypothetical protein CMO81_07245 [Waddliaceae bacterium]|nr:hypothetical protein [Waddliaceae bacterium]